MLLIERYIEFTNLTFYYNHIHYFCYLFVTRIQNQLYLHQKSKLLQYQLEF